MTLSEAALKYVGVPFRHMGRTTAGVDCAGLILLATKDCGYEAKDTPTYGPEPRGDIIQRTLVAHDCKLVKRPPQVNDIVILSFRKNGPAVHLGIIAEHPHGLGLVHTYGHIGRVVYQRLDEKKQQRIEAVLEFQHG